MKFKKLQKRAFGLKIIYVTHIHTKNWLPKIDVRPLVIIVGCRIDLFSILMSSESMTIFKIKLLQKFNALFVKNLKI